MAGQFGVEGSTSSWTRSEGGRSLPQGDRRRACHAEGSSRPQEDPRVGDSRSVKSADDFIESSDLEQKLLVPYYVSETVFMDCAPCSTTRWKPAVAALRSRGCGATPGSNPAPSIVELAEDRTRDSCAEAGLSVR
jgi:hypothetical protein